MTAPDLVPAGADVAMVPDFVPANPDFAAATRARA